MREISLYLGMPLGGVVLFRKIGNVGLEGSFQWFLGFLGKITLGFYYQSISVLEPMISFYFQHLRCFLELRLPGWNLVVCHTKHNQYIPAIPYKCKE